MPSLIRVAVDGSANPNPGRMAVGAVVFDAADHLIFQAHKKLPRGTNSIAEYCALIEGLKLIFQKGYKDVEILTDSQFLYNQIVGNYGVKKKHLWDFYSEAKGLIDQCARHRVNLRITWHPRETDLARAADALSKGIELTLGGPLCQIIKNLEVLEPLLRGEKSLVKDRVSEEEHRRFARVVAQRVAPVVVPLSASSSETKTSRGWTKWNSKSVLADLRSQLPS